ncbi:hypothetical protein ABKN59_007554 [Abortiporus biennis]
MALGAWRRNFILKTQPFCQLADEHRNSLSSRATWNIQLLSCLDLHGHINGIVTQRAARANFVFDPLHEAANPFATYIGFPGSFTPLIATSRKCFDEP